MTYCISRSWSRFSSFSYFISYLCFMYLHFIYFSCYHYIRHFTYFHSIMLCIHTSFIYSSPSMNLFYLEIGIIPIGSFKLKLWHCYAKLVNLPILPEGQFEILIFQCLDSIFDTGSLYSLKFKVLKVLLQLESPKSEHRNSRYVRNNPNYSMSKTEAEFGWNMAPL